MNKELFTNGSIEGKANIPKSYKCAYCLKEFEKAPKEHILQNTFGAKWTSNTISCEECQKYFGKHFDVPCEEHIRLYRNLLNTGTDRERKKVPKINDVQCDNGYSYTLHPGGVPNLSKPHIEKTPDGCRIIMGRMKDIGQGLHLAKKILGAEELLIEGEPLKVREKLPPLHYRFPRVGLTVAKAFLKAGFNMLAEKNKELSLSSVFNDFRTFMMEGGEEDLSSFFRFPAEKICLLDEFETAFHHQLYVYSRGSTVEGAIKIFGAFMYHLRFSNTYKGESFCYAYITDPQKNNNRRKRFHR